MRDLFTKSFFTVQPGQAVSGIAHKAETLQVQRGRVWITMEGASQDYWLSAGDTFTVEPGRLLVVEVEGNDKTAGRIDLLQTRPQSLSFKVGAQLISLGQRLTSQQPGMAPAQC